MPQSRFELLLLGSQFVPLGLQPVVVVLQAMDAGSGLLQDHRLGGLVVAGQFGYVVAKAHKTALKLVAPLPFHHVVSPTPLLLVLRFRRVVLVMAAGVPVGRGRRRGSRRRCGVVVLQLDVKVEAALESATLQLLLFLLLSGGAASHRHHVDLFLCRTTTGKTLIAHSHEISVFS